mmetsp:Transcript_66353/g.76978  ORF Transcript_66353/g.76978 Transcript_66353/m.76978 type:complete len:269 (+) Transcript_66353:98-904(+)
MHIVLRFLATVYIFAGILISWVLIWLLQTVARTLMLPFATKDQMDDVCGHIFRKVSWVFVDLINPFWYSRVLKPFPKMQKGEKFIVVLNHLSNADPWFAIRSLFPWDCKWICKGSLFKVPFGGWALKNNGDLAIKFTKEKGGWGTEKGSVGMLMEDAKKLLQRAQPIAVFPEGVRNPKPEGPLGEFKLGFFTLAVQEGVKVVPMALSGSETAWPVKDWKFDFSTCYLSAGEPIDPTGMTAEELRDKVYNVITEMRESHPDRLKLKKAE